MTRMTCLRLLQVIFFGRLLVALPEESVLAIDLNRQMVLSMATSKCLEKTHFGFLFSDYLHHLLQKNKWCKTSPNFQINKLVLVRNLLPPGKWELARIVQTHPGSDELVRVVTVRTARAVLKRPIL